MGIWIVILLMMLAGILAGLTYLSFQMALWPVFQKLGKGRNRRCRGIALGVNVGILILLSLLLNAMNAAVIYLHVLVFWLCEAGIRRIVKRFRRTESSAKAHRLPAGVIAVIVTVIYLVPGVYQVYHVRMTQYDLTTEKQVEPLKVAMFSDSHIGVTFDGKGLRRYIDEIAEEEPDVLIIAGDFVDDDTSKQDMIDGCEALSHIHPRYGIYYVFGNHDKGYYKRSYSGEDLCRELERNGVTVLQDEIVEIGDGYCIVGRQDRSEDQRGGSRASAAELMAQVAPERYAIMLDHQPNDYRAEQEAGPDLVLSGHTHGGQLIPLQWLGVWTGQNDKAYGLEKRGRTEFLVSSGISNWALYFKTGCWSEYVIINIAHDE